MIGCGLIFTSGSPTSFDPASRIAHRGLAPFAVRAVDEQHAVEMVGLVLQAACQVTCADHLDRIPAGREALATA